ncbi:MAG: hypothetical protein ACLU0O_06150 [Collinsella sp.]
MIEHDLDLIRNADYVIDMGGRWRRGRIVCAGRAYRQSITGRYL